MRFLMILSFLFGSSAFAEDKAEKTKQACPEMQGYIVMDGSSDITYYHWTGEEGFKITNYNLIGVQRESFQNKKEGFFLKFTKKDSLESQLYSAQDCSVKGSISITDVSQIGTKPISFLNPQ